MTDYDVLSRINELLVTQRFGVLATREDDYHPYANLVAFATERGPERLLFATHRATRKFRNLECDPRVAILIDNRSNAEIDLRDAIAITVLGAVAEVEDVQRDAKNTAFLAKHPSMREFICSPSCAMFEVAVERIYAVTRFQSVLEIHFQDGAAHVVDSPRP